MTSNQHLSQDNNEETSFTEPPPPYTRFPEQHEIIPDQNVPLNPAPPLPSRNPYPQHNVYTQPSPAQAYPQYHQPSSSFHNPNQNINTPAIPNGSAFNPQKQYSPYNTIAPPNSYTGPRPLQQYPQQWPSTPQIPFTGYNQAQPMNYPTSPPAGPSNFNFVCNHCGNRGWKRPGKLCTHCPYGQQLINSGINRPGTVLAPGVYVVRGRPCYKCKGQGNTLPIQLPIISNLANTLVPSVCSVCHGKGYI